MGCLLLFFYLSFGYLSQLEYVSLNDVPIGTELADTVTQDVTRILRLLHIRELRELQTRINTTVVAVQALTADPRTDERLGKVGR